MNRARGRVRHGEAISDPLAVDPQRLERNALEPRRHADEVLDPVEEPVPCEGAEERSPEVVRASDDRLDARREHRLRLGGEVLGERANALGRRGPVRAPRRRDEAPGGRPLVAQEPGVGPAFAEVLGLEPADGGLGVGQRRADVVESPGRLDLADLLQRQPTAQRKSMTRSPGLWVILWMVTS